MTNGSSGFAAGLIRALLILLVVAGVPVIAGVFLIQSATQPAPSRESQDPSEVLLNVEEVSLHAADNVALSAWFIKGRAGAPPILLCHDLGGSRSDLVNAAVVLNKAGYPLLLLDFRRHGESGAARSTLGVHERLDVLAGVRYLQGRKLGGTGRMGGWGVGMGAYALALAALEAPQLKALALDSLDPDVPSEVDRLVRQKLPPALHSVVPALRLLYNPCLRARLGDFAVRDHLAKLAGRNLLFIAGSEAPDRLDEERLLYEALPEGPEGGKNLLELRRSGLIGLYAEDRKKYDETIVGFFTTYLPFGPAGESADGPIEVIER